ncbi:hypothetical protein V6N11_009525 [Hibiscus sabdariffa]|uniref:Uncharacterized protein n=1 Tax=Hibiscus sabdariffa TaxID=183260 RepID=A0ABR2P5K7_9ROSI
MFRKQHVSQGGLSVQEATSSDHSQLKRNSSPEDGEETEFFEQEGDTMAVHDQQPNQPEPMEVPRADELPEVDDTELSVAEEPQLSMGSQFLESQQPTYEGVEQTTNEAGVLDESQNQTVLSQQQVSRTHVYA